MRQILYGALGILMLSCSAFAATESPLAMDPILAAIVSNQACLAKINGLVHRVGPLTRATLIQQRGAANGGDCRLYFGARGSERWLTVPVTFMGGDRRHPSLFFAEDGGTEGPAAPR